MPAEQIRPKDYCERAARARFRVVHPSIGGESDDDCPVCALPVRSLEACVQQPVLRGRSSL
ncbi:uncharacterized protein V6R79_014334 [Siganus canaliculatus]